LFAEQNDAEYDGKYRDEIGMDYAAHRPNPAGQNGGQ